MPTVNADRQWGVGRITVIAAAVCLTQFIATGKSMAQDSLIVITAQAGPEQTNPVVEYREYISSIEFNHGHLSNRLSEPLTSLGTALHEQGDYTGAQSAYNRALEIIRINNGLYSLDQIPVMEQIIGNLAAQGDWRNVDVSFHRMFWIHRRAIEESDPEILRAIDRQIAWHFAAVNFTNGVTTAEHLLKARDLCALAVEIIERQPDHHQQELAAWLYRQSQSDYYIAVAVQRAGDTGLALVNELAYHQLRYGYDQAAEWLLRRIYRDGMRNFEKMSPGQPSQMAIAAIYQADWNMLFSKYNYASGLYRAAYARLIETGIASETLNSFFNSPIILPVEIYRLDLNYADVNRKIHFTDDAAMLHETQDTAVDTRPEFIAWSDALPGLRMPSRGDLDFTPPPVDNRAIATFDVDVTGLAERIKILDYNRDHHSNRNRAYETIWSMQFRPRLENGETRPATGMTVNFVVTD